MECSSSSSLLWFIFFSWTKKLLIKNKNVHWSRLFLFLLWHILSPQKWMCVTFSQDWSSCQWFECWDFTMKHLPWTCSNWKWHEFFLSIKETQSDTWKFIPQGIISRSTGFVANDVSLKSYMFANKVTSRC